tara:strand:+ start:2089 stop:4134 length:2046 start_codon:yes stop_codon:yes gene_type:complete
MSVNPKHINPLEELTKDKILYFCIENDFYRNYLTRNCDDEHISYRNLELIDLPGTISANPNAVILLQSESKEQNIIDLSAKLKLLFGSDVKSILLSTDYRVATEVEFKFDEFIHFPADFEQIINSITKVLNASKKILLIDDSKLIHKNLVPPLSENGYEVFQAFDGLEGLQQAKTIRPDLIILDVEMPKMNGFEVCQEIRKSELTQDIYVMMSSTLTSAADQSMGFESGVDEYVTKPLDIDELLDRLKKVLFSSPAGRENIILLSHDEAVAQTNAKSLRKQGFTVKTCQTIRETVHRLNSFNAVLVLSEIDPLDGTVPDLVKHLNFDEPDKKIELIIITDRDSPSDSKMVMNTGASAVISKPFTNDGLLATVEKTLAERNLRIENVQIQKYLSKASRRIAVEKSILLDHSSQTFAQNKNATIFFSDIVGFTGRCERYSAEEIVTQINGLFESITGVIVEHDGDIDKFIGDACMAFWLDDDSDISVVNAVRTVLAMKSNLDQFNSSQSGLDDDPIRMRVGLNTGGVILCDIGAASNRVDLTIIGDAVNVAARMESAAKLYGLDHLISEGTVDRTDGYFEYRLIDRVVVKGKNEPVNCYQLLSETGDSSSVQQALQETYDHALQAYFAGDFNLAVNEFKKSAEFEEPGVHADLNPSQVFLDRCERLLDEKPRQWNGVWELLNK